MTHGGVSRIVDVTVRDNFLGLCDKNIVHKQKSDFDHLQSYGHLTLKETRYIWEISILLRYLYVPYSFSFGF